MEKKLNDYLHLYLGCPIFKTGTKLVSVNLEDEEYTILEDDGFNDRVLSMTNTNPKLILRPLSDMTDSELIDFTKLFGDGREFSDEDRKEALQIINKKGIGAISFNDESSENVFEMVRWFLSKHFDIFGLIDAGLAIEKKVESQTQ